MKKYFSILVLSFAFLGSNTLHSQVSSDHSAAKSVQKLRANQKKGVIPKMDTNQRNSLEAPAKGMLVQDTNSQCIFKNLGTTTKPVWVNLSDNNTQGDYFYIPAVDVPVSNLGASSSIDLYELYKNQFQTPMIGSTGAPESIENFPLASELYYFITEFDKDLIQINKVDENGKVSYQALQEVDQASYMNIVVVLK